MIRYIILYTTFILIINLLVTGSAISQEIVKSDSKTSFSTQSFYSTVRLVWEKDSNPKVAGYAIYRKPFGANDNESVKQMVANDSLEDNIVFIDYGLNPGSKYEYKITSVDAYGNILEIKNETTIKLNNDNTKLNRVANFKLLVAIYKFGISQENIEKTIASIKKGIEFFYRNSLCRLNMQPTFLLIDSECPSTQGPTLDGVVTDLKSRGICDDEYDLFFLIANNLDGFIGGWCIFGNTFGGYGYSPDSNMPSPYVSDNNVYSGQIWIFVHELGHGLDFLSDSQGFYMIFNHPPWAFPINEGYSFVAGEHFDCMSQILRQFKNYSDYKPPHDDYLEYIDSDMDGLADDDKMLPIDESRFNSNKFNPDTDGDGLNDLEEYSAGIYTSSDPNNPDTDNDGKPDGNDLTPLCDFSEYIIKFDTPPDMDNTDFTNWTRLASKPSFQKDNELKTVFYAGWDDDYLYIGAISNKNISIWLSLDGSGQNGRWVTDGVFEDFSDWEKFKYTDQAYGDCYDGDKVLYINPCNDKLIKGSEIISDSYIFNKYYDQKWITKCKIPKDLGYGTGFSYWDNNASIIKGLRLQEGRILGFQFVYSCIGYGHNIWSGEWSSLNEVFHYYTSKLTSEK